MRTPSHRQLLLAAVCLQWSSLLVDAFGGLHLGAIPDFPESVIIRAAVLTNTVPLAWYDENYTINNPIQNQEESPFPEYRGVQPDILRNLITIAKELDNVTLTFELEQAPPFSYAAQFEHMASDCGFTANQFTNEEVLSEEDCNRLDMIVGDYYGYPTRSIRTMLTPSFLATAGATIQYIYRRKRVITTLQEAETLQEPVCLLDGSHFDRTTLMLYPNLTVQRCSNHDECLQFLKADACALFVEDRLQLRYFTTQDATLQVTPESFNENFIVWPMSARLDPLIQQLIIRWMYQAKVTGVLDELDKNYFSIRYCPLGKAGKNCDQPCSATHGTSDRYGICVCESTRWTGEDCSVEALEDQNLIPSTLKIISYIMVGINFLAVTICAVWLYWNRNTPQVKVSQPLFLGMVLLGCLISTSTIFALAAEDEGNVIPGEEGDTIEYGQAGLSSCMAIPWLYSVGFCITFGSLFAKIRRVYVLFKAAATMQRAKVTAQETFFIVGGVLLIDVTILTVWTIMDPLEWDRDPITMDKYGHTLSSEGYCRSDHFEIFASIIAAFHFTIMGVACYLCYLSREIPTQFAEGKYVTVAMISNLQIFVVAIPVLIILGSDPETSFFVRSVIIWMNDLVVLGLIFGNLMLSVHGDFVDNSDSKVMIREAMNTYQSRRNKRKSTLATRDSSSPRQWNAGNSSYIPTPSTLSYGGQESIFEESGHNPQPANASWNLQTTSAPLSLKSLPEEEESDPDKDVLKVLSDSIGALGDAFLDEDDDADLQSIGENSSDSSKERSDYTSSTDGEIKRAVYVETSPGSGSFAAPAMHATGEWTPSNPGGNLLDQNHDNQSIRLLLGYDERHGPSLKDEKEGASTDTAESSHGEPNFREMYFT